MLSFQKNDGNLVLYKAAPNNQKAWMWDAKKYNYGQNAQTKVKLQKDGNLVVYKNGSNDAVWATNKYGPETNDVQAVVQDDGNFVIYKNGQPIWSSRTQMVPPNGAIPQCSQ